MNATLPQPAQPRWQPLRLGLIELYHYDVEEFWFTDGHLMLRGNNGTGKSKVLSLTLPFLLDANLMAARVEPDADPKKRMDWNLLMGGRHDRRTGYAWIEFGRLDADGAARFLTLGAGLRAVAGRGHVDSWFFASAQRVGRDLPLVDVNHTVATRERLAEAIGRHNVFTTARDYRRVVDEQLYGLGSERYRALIDTLIQLRQPQLSKQPDEKNLSRALTQAFPPLQRGVLEDVAEAMNQLDEHRDELEDYAAMQQAVARFNDSHGCYARILARRRARDLRQAETQVDQASAAARAAREAHDKARHTLARTQQQVTDCETRQTEVTGQIEVLRDSPEMRSAHELQRAEREAESAAHSAASARADAKRARVRHDHEQAGVAQRCQTVDSTRTTLQQALQDSHAQAEAAGVAPQHRDSLGDTADLDTWAGQAKAGPMHEAQRHIASTRNDQIRQVQRGLDAMDKAGAAQRAARHERDARQADSEAAESDLETARQACREAAESHIAAWADFGEQVRQTLNQSAASEWPAAEDVLADWVHSLEGPSPLASHWEQVAEDERNRHAAIESDLRQQLETVAAERTPLVAEQQQLQAGREAPPPPPPTREADRTAQPGAPLWQLVDFAVDVAAADRAGIEAALQASGLLDAWLTPAGELLDPHTSDSWLQACTPQAHNLNSVLQFDTSAAHGPVAAATVEAVLAGIALAEQADPSATEYWLAADGRYRLGPLQGAWYKSQAEYIGYAAREAARQRRLEEIEQELQALRQHQSAIEAEQKQLTEQRRAFRQLQDRQPRDDALRRAHAEQAAAEKRAAGARQQLSEAEQRLQAARHEYERAQESVTLDAGDAGLPVKRAELEAVARAVGEYRLAIQALNAARQEQARALQELAMQQKRASSAEKDWTAADETASDAEDRAATARARHDELARTVGASAEEVLGRLNARIRERDQLEDELKVMRQTLAEGHQQLGTTEQAATDTAQRLDEAQTARQNAAMAFHAFAATGLLRAAVPDLDVPDTQETWTHDTALTMARHTETALNEVDDGDEAWQRAQNRLGNEFTELQRSLSARGFDCFGEPGEHGFVVRITFNQRSEAPDALQAMLESEVAERRRLLTARETEIIENHLQAEVASQLQALMQAASRRVEAINRELAQRPTSTGVKFKLVWEPLPDEDGTLARLADVRKLLLSRVSDAWSPDDRAAVGAFLQERIHAERERDASAARIDQLAAALDYRAWHRFRVRRWQDGQWKPLSGPASSGERALGLTVPLFAAAASHYESAADYAPRLVLLDEAFAGIDDAARAHCMDLIREFDLDFVMTSEREWACYPELPGVSICHLVRRADIEAVFVSRWRWNGRDRLRVDSSPDLVHGSA